MAPGCGAEGAPAATRANGDEEVELGGPGAMRRKPSNYALLFAATVVCATLNNFSYCVISGASQDMARHFGRENDSTVITTIMNLSAICATVVSARCLIRYRYAVRIVLVLALTSVAYAGIAATGLANSAAGFWICGVCASFGGFAQIFGETTNLGFLKNFPPEMVGAWGAGTGIAGIAGPLLYLALRVHLPYWAVFLCAAPLPAIYGACFWYLHAEATRGLSGPRLQRALGGCDGPPAASLGSDPQELLNGNGGRHVAASATPANIKAAVRASGGVMFNLVAVYCLEYTIYPGLDDRETFCATGSWYTVMWVCYNVGVTLSRSSVALFRIRRLWILTLVQLCNVIGWTLEVFQGGIRNSAGSYSIMAGWMVLVGLCGGATYANCMYMFNQEESIPDHLRELGINLGFFMSNVGISMATLSFIALDRTVFSPAVLYPSGCRGA